MARPSGKSGFDSDGPDVSDAEVTSHADVSASTTTIYIARSVGITRRQSVADNRLRSISEFNFASAAAPPTQMPLSARRSVRYVQRRSWSCSGEFPGRGYQGAGEHHRILQDLDMTAVRHCRHCWGDCLGECLLGDTGMCIHGRNSRMTPRMRAQWLLRRKWWRRVFWGAR